MRLRRPHHQNIENNPMHSSLQGRLAVAGLHDPAKTICLVGQIRCIMRNPQNANEPVAARGPHDFAARSQEQNLYFWKTTLNILRRDRTGFGNASQPPDAQRDAQSQCGVQI